MNAKQTAAVVDKGKNGATCHRSDGKICDARPIAGSTVCRRHIVNPKARANAAVRAEVLAWKLQDQTLDPGTVLLRLMTQAYHRAALYTLLLEGMYNADAEGEQTTELPAGVGALIGWKYTAAEGRRIPVAEAIRGLVDLEGQERDRAVRYSKLALDAGIAERLVQIEQDKASVLVTVLRAVVTRLGLDPADPMVIDVVTSELRAIEGAA